MDISTYSRYFETLAQQHQQIKHTPEDEQSMDAIGERRFALYNADDVLAKSFRTSLGSPALMAEIYETSFIAGEVYDPKMQYRAAFSVVVKGSAKDPASEVQCLALAEQIMWDMIQKLYHDHTTGNTNGGCPLPFKTIEVQNANIVSFGPIWDWWFGWRFEYGFRPKATRKLTDPLPDGIFIP